MFMRNILKRCFSWLLLGVISFSVLSLSACNEEEGGNTETPAQVAYTDIDLVKNNTSEYSVVIPAGNDETVAFAASELVTFFEQATGYELPIKTDTGVRYDEDQKIISIWETVAWDGVDINLSYDEFGQDGAFLTRKGNQLFLCGAEKWGALNAVYEFLSLQFHYEAYSVDEIYIDRTSDMKLLDLQNVKSIPAIESRGAGAAALSEDPIYATRMRLVLGKRYGMKDNIYADADHSVSRILPRDTYRSKHPDWYAASGQVCLPKYFTDPLFKETFLNNMKAKILEKPESTAYQLGMDDANTTHETPETQEFTDERGGPAGVLMALANAVSKDINAWLAEIGDPRADNFLISILAYIKYETAPVISGEKAGEFLPAHPDVKGGKNVAVMLCLYSMNNIYGADDEGKNMQYSALLKQWSAITENLEIWFYSANYSNFMIPYNNFQSYKDNAIAFEKYNVSYIRENNSPAVQPFRQLRNYIWGKLLWNPHQDVNVLVDNFFYYYYKEAAPYVKEYYDLMRTHYSVLEQQFAEAGKQLPGGMYETAIQAGEQVFTFAFTKKINQIMDKAVEVASQIEDEARRDIILFRTKRESLAPKFFMIDVHQSSLSNNEARHYIDEFEEWSADCGLVQWVENETRSGTLADKIAGWRKNLDMIGG